MYAIEEICCRLLCVCKCVDVVVIHYLITLTRRHFSIFHNEKSPKIMTKKKMLQLTTNLIPKMDETTICLIQSNEQ